MQASALTTALFVIVTGAGLFSNGARLLVAVVSLLMFVVGTVLMAVAIVIAVRRSRESVIGIGDVFFSVPKVLLWCLGIQTVVALGTAGAHTNTGAAFAVLAPIGALGFCGLWGARRGTFPTREVK